MRTIRILVFLSAIAFAASASAATISGVITDSTGAALPSTLVTLKALGSGQTRRRLSFRPAAAVPARAGLDALAQRLRHPGFLAPLHLRGRRHHVGAALG